MIYFIQRIDQKIIVIDLDVSGFSKQYKYYQDATLQGLPVLQIAKQTGSVQLVDWFLGLHPRKQHQFPFQPVLV